MTKHAAAEFAKFMIVGLSNFVVSYGTFLAFVAIFSKSALSAGMAQAVSYSAGIVWSYYWNGRWTFGIQSTNGNTFMKFALLQVTLMVISSISIGMWVAQSGLAPGIIWILVMVPITILNFVGTRQFVFRRAVQATNHDAA